MGRCPCLTEHQRHEAMGRLNTGQRVHDVVQYLGVRDSSLPYHNSDNAYTKLGKFEIDHVLGDHE